METFSHLKKKLAQSRVDEVITELINITETNAMYKRHYNNVIMISGQYSSLKTSSIRGIVADEYLERKKNRISNALIEMLDYLDTEDYIIPINDFEEIIIGPESKADIPKHIIDAIKKKKEELKREELSFLLIGRTGVGKSSTINSLFGEEIAKIGKYQPTTVDVKNYGKLVFGGVNLNIFDTPGLCDALPEKNNDQEYVKLIKDKVTKFDCMLFVSNLSDNRVTGDEMRAIKIVSLALGKEVWNHAVIVFTHSSKVSKEDFEEALTIRSKLIRQEIKQWVGNGLNIDTIPSIAIDNLQRTNPDGSEWISKFFTTVFTRLTDKGLMPFLVALKNDIDFEEPEDGLSQEQGHEFDSKINPGRKKKSKKKGRIILSDSDLLSFGERLNSNSLPNNYYAQQPTRQPIEPRVVETGSFVQENLSVFSNGYQTVISYTKVVINYVKTWWW